MERATTSLAIDDHACHALSTSAPLSGGFRKQLWSFARHYLEMCAAMCVGEAVLDGLLLGALWLVGYSNPFELASQFPELAAAIIAINMTLPMSAWMRFRGMEWRPILEMSGAMVLEAIALVGAAWLGVIPRSAVMPLEYALMMPIMLVPMLFRLDLYTGRAGHHAHSA